MTYIEADEAEGGPTLHAYLFMLSQYDQDHDRLVRTLIIMRQPQMDGGLVMKVNDNYWLWTGNYPYAYDTNWEVTRSIERRPSWATIRCLRRYEKELIALEEEKNVHER